jgi:hypothetical protein
MHKAAGGNAVRRDHPKFDGTIGDQHAVTRTDIPGEVLIHGGGALLRAQALFGGDLKNRTRFEPYLSAIKQTQANLGPLQVEQDADGTIQFGGEFRTNRKRRA